MYSPHHIKLKNSRLFSYVNTHCNVLPVSLCVACSSVFQWGSCTPANPTLCSPCCSASKTARYPETTKASFTQKLTHTHLHTRMHTSMCALRERGRATCRQESEKRKESKSITAADVAGWVKDDAERGGGLIIHRSG